MHLSLLGRKEPAPSLEEAVENLRERDRARSSKVIGYADLRQQRVSQTAV